MICDPLAATGQNVDLGVLLIIAILCFLAGSAVVFLARKQSRRGTEVAAATLLALIVGATIAVTPAASARAAESECNSADNSLTITQTSVLRGLTPGIPPVPIAGLVVNHGTESTYITAVRVEIASVTPGTEAPMGTCTASDFELLDSLMPVGLTLAPEGSRPFTGASIGFVNKPTNQDACKHAVVHLLYTANPP